MYKTVLLILLMYGLIVGSAQAAIIVANPGFETDLTGASITSYPAAGALPGWSVTGGVETLTSAFWAPSEGVRSLDLNGTQPGAISQVIGGFTVGAQYELLFDMGGNFYSGATFQTAKVGIAGLSQDFTYVPDPGDTAALFTWKEQSLIFFATGTSQTLSFSQVSLFSAAGAALDNIRIQLIGGGPTAGVPVPAITSLLLVGLAGIGFVARQNKVA